MSKDEGCFAGYYYDGSILLFNGNGDKVELDSPYLDGVFAMHMDSRIPKKVERHKINRVYCVDFDNPQWLKMDIYRNGGIETVSIKSNLVKDIAWMPKSHRDPYLITNHDDFFMLRGRNFGVLVDLVSFDDKHGKVDDVFTKSFDEMSRRIDKHTSAYGIADKVEFGYIYNFHSELEEYLEYLCKNEDCPDKEFPQFSTSEMDLADALINIMATAGAHNWRLAEAVLAKLDSNMSK